MVIPSLFRELVSEQAVQELSEDLLFYVSGRYHQVSISATLIRSGVYSPSTMGSNTWMR